MASNVGELKARLSLDASGFSTGVGKAKADVAGLKKTADDAARGMRSAAGANANLVSQFNDIGVMLAAGQNPLQLALQQGTQISQVLTQMGGGVGALRALGGAFVGMLNPISLATIGVIGFGAAAVQWLMPAKDEAKKTEDAFKTLKESMSGYNDAFGVSLLYTGQAEKLYGEEAQRGAAIARKIMVMEAQRTRTTVAGIIGKAYSDFGFDAYGERGIDGAGRIESANLAQAAGKLGFKSDSWGESLWGFGGLDREKLAIAERFGNTMRDIYAYLGKPVPEGGLDAYLIGLREKLEAFDTQLKAAREAGADSATLATIDEQMIPLQRALLEGEKQRADIRAADAAKAEEMLATYAHEAEIKALTLEYGKESREVTEYQAQAEREKQYLLIDSMNITDEMKQKLWDAADASFDATMQTWDWQAAMAAVNAELAGAASLISSIGGGMVQRAGFSAANAVLDAGGTAISAEKARRRAEERQGFINQANTADGYMSSAMIDAQLSEMERQWAAQDAYEARLDAVRKGERAASKKAGGSGRKGGKARGGRGRASPGEKWGDDVEKYQRETDAFLAQVDALAKVTAAGGDWERALAKIEEEQGLLNAAQKAGIEITPEVKARISELAQAHVDAEEKLENLRTATERGEDAFKDLFGSILEGADSAKEAIANLIAEIAKVQFTKAAMGLLGQTSWGSGLMQSVGSLLSFDGGGHTGPGARSGGLDGKGGFLGILHPDETVYDHTKAQTAGGGTMIVRASHDPGIILEVIDSRIGAAAPSIQRGAVQQTMQANRKSKSMFR